MNVYCKLLQIFIWKQVRHKQDMSPHIVSADRLIIGRRCRKHGLQVLFLLMDIGESPLQMRGPE